MSAITESSPNAAETLPDFERRVTAFFTEHATPRRTDDAGRMVARGPYAEHVSAGDERAIVEAARGYQRALADAGLCGLSAPAAYGGQGLTIAHERAFSRIASRYELPPAMPLAVALALVVPTILAHGSEEQKEQHVAQIVRGEETWCQLFSEPGAGSDLAGLSTRAVQDGDEWVVDGQKVWTSFATFAQYGLMMARTDLEAPPHKGITMFAVPMDTPGIDIRPLKEMTGGTHFSEVFLSGVRLRDEHRIGAVGNGWKVAMTTLGSERANGSQEVPWRGHALIGLARETGRADDPGLRRAIARVCAHERALTLMAERVDREYEAGTPPAWAGSALKVAHANLEQEAAHTALLVGGRGTVAWSEPAGERLAWEALYSRMWSIAGGSNEIQKNILAERVLGLPREARPA